jgi:hypothetical protein
MLAMGVILEKGQVSQYPRKHAFDPRFLDTFDPRCFYRNFLRSLSYEVGQSVVVLLYICSTE